VSVEVVANKGQDSSSCNNGTAKRTEDTDDTDEIKLYIKGRFLCSMDAVWRILGYHTYPATEPSVLTVKCKLPQQVLLLLEDGKCCDMLIYLERPQQLNHLKMGEFFKVYDYGTYIKPFVYERHHFINHISIYLQI
jgi:hypothetical protein